MRRLALVLFVALLMSGAARARFQSLRAADPGQQIRTATDPGFLRYDPGLRPAWAASRFPLVIEQPRPGEARGASPAATACAGTDTGTGADF